MKPAASASQATKATLGTLWRGARPGLVFVTLLMLATALINTVSRQSPLQFTGLTLITHTLAGLIVGALLSQIRSQALARLAPGSATALRRLVLGLVALALVISSAGPLWHQARNLAQGTASVAAWMWLWPLAVPAVAWAAALAAMARRRGPFWALQALTLSAFVLMQTSVVNAVMTQPAPLRDAALAAIATAGLMWSAHLLRGALRLWAAPHELPAVPVRGLGFLMMLAADRSQTWQAEGQPAHDSGGAMLPAQLRRLAAASLLMPMVQPGKLRTQRIGLVVSLALMVLTVHLLDMHPSFACWMATVMGTAMAPFLADTWVSPRWPLLPGAPARQDMAWALASNALRRGLPRVLGYAGLFVLALGLPLGAGPADLAAMMALALASALLAGSMALLVRPWRKQAPSAAAAQAGDLRFPAGLVVAPLLTSALLLGAWSLGPLPILQIGWGPELWRTAALVLGAALLLSLLMVLASRPLWARFDWTRMPSLPMGMAPLR